MNYLLNQTGYVPLESLVLIEVFCSFIGDSCILSLSDSELDLESFFSLLQRPLWFEGR